MKRRRQNGKNDWKKNAYILFKDHKPNLYNKNQFKLINPLKTELGIISKDFIENIVLNIQKN